MEWKCRLGEKTSLQYKFVQIFALANICKKNSLNIDQNWEKSNSGHFVPACSSVRKIHLFTFLRFSNSDLWFPSKYALVFTPSFLNNPFSLYCIRYRGIVLNKVHIVHWTGIYGTQKLGVALFFMSYGRRPTRAAPLSSCSQRLPPISCTTSSTSRTPPAPWRTPQAAAASLARCTSWSLSASSAALVFAAPSLSFLGFQFV